MPPPPPAPPRPAPPRSSQGFSGPVDINKDVFDYVGTVLPRTGATCSPWYHGCQTFQYITCGLLA